MGLFDGIIASLMGQNQNANPTGTPPASNSALGALVNKLKASNQGQGATVLMTAMGLLQQHGGLAAVLDKFRQNGMAEHVESWVGNGPNQGISATQVQQVFGSSSIANVASQLGQTHGQASSLIAQILPELVNHFTPQGQVPSNHADLLSEALGLLRGGTSSQPGQSQPRMGA